MKKDTTFINEAVRKYKSALHRVITISERYNNMNLDKAEHEKSKAFSNTMELYYKQNGFLTDYSKECNFKKDLRNNLEKIDILVFGCKNDYGINLGYDFSITRAKQNKYLLKN